MTGGESMVKKPVSQRNRRLVKLRRTMRLRLMRAMPALLILVVMSTAGMVVFAMTGKVTDPGPRPEKKEIEVIVIPPPPPPPPPPPEKPPEPEEVEIEEEVPEEAPEEMESDEPPPGELLGLDAEGAAGGDDFGLVAKRGGRGLLAGGSNRRAIAFYDRSLQRNLEQILNGADTADARGRDYSIRVKIWIDDGGAVESFQLVESTGDPEVDTALTTALNDAGRVAGEPPEGWPQPVIMRFTVRL